MGTKSFFLFGVILFLSFPKSGFAGDIQMTCRGESPEYGAFAISIEDGFSGQAIFRNCRLAKELASHIGAPEAAYDSFQMAALGVKCTVEEKGDQALVCPFKPLVGEESLDDIGGVPVELGPTHGLTRITALKKGGAEIYVELQRKEKPFSRTLAFPKLECEDGLTIKETEATCGI